MEWKRIPNPPKAQALFEYSGSLSVLLSDCDCAVLLHLHWWNGLCRDEDSVYSCRCHHMRREDAGNRRSEWSRCDLFASGIQNEIPGPKLYTQHSLITCWGEMTLWMERDMYFSEKKPVLMSAEEKKQKKNGQHSIPKSSECTSSKLWIINDLSETFRTSLAGQSLVHKFLWKYVEIE